MFWLHYYRFCHAFLAAGIADKELGPLLERLDQHFICVHAHPNNCCGEFQLAGSKLNLPNVHELTFMHRDRFLGVAEADCYAPMLPHPLDISSNVSNKPPIFLNEHWLTSGRRSPESTIKLLSDQVDYLERTLKQVRTPEDTLIDLHRLTQRVSAALPALAQKPATEALVDLAAGKPFALSSQYGAIPKDGRVREQRPFFFHTMEGCNQSITIDLEATYQLHELRITNRTDVCLARARCLFYCLHYEPQPDFQQGLPVMVDKEFLTKADRVCVTDLRGERARYLTIFSPENTMLHFSAIQIFGVIKEQA
jgi:hypothetical protein